MKYKFWKLSVTILIGVFLSVMTVFAFPNVSEQLAIWYESNKEAAISDVSKQLDESIANEKIELLETKHQELDQILANLNDISSKEANRSSNAIQEHFNHHKAALEAAHAEIEEQQSEDFGNIISKATTQTNGIFNTISQDIENDFEQSSPTEWESTYESHDASELLEEEIQQTLATIGELQILLKEEENLEIQAYIDDKIQLLQDLIVVLRRN